VHVPGTYPHAQWQGSRLEGFVVAQGQHVNSETVQKLRELAAAAESQRIDLTAVPMELRTPYRDTIKRVVSTTATTDGHDATIPLPDAASSAGTVPTQDMQVPAQAAEDASGVPSLPAEDAAIRSERVKAAVIEAVAADNASWLPVVSRGKRLAAKIEDLILAYKV
jgi:hypothetical protein